MNITYHDELEEVSPYPGLVRLITMDKQFGAGAITQGMVRIEVGGAVKPHTHLIEESITILDGDARILCGDEQVEVRGRRCTFVAPGNTVHAIRNIGDRPVQLCIAYPGVGVTAQLVDVDF